MATLVLRSAGAALGTALGGPLGGLVGGAIGAVGGAVVDNLLADALASRRDRTPQLDTVAITHAEEGAPVRKLWGRMRLGGNVIWCTQFQAVTTKRKTASGSGKGDGTTKVTSFELSFAVAFCEGSDDVTLGRVWADGNELDLGQYGYRFYSGSEEQEPDSWIESAEGTGAVPAYRGTCYLVFNLMPLDDFGNRMPQITAEIVRRPPIDDPDDVTATLRSVCLLPGAGEFVLGTEVYQSSDGFGSWFPENVHTPNGVPDLVSSLDQLDATLPDRAAVSLVVTWFGTDLRAGTCRIVPKVETATKTVQPADWAVAGLTRAGAEVVSQIAAAALDPTGLGELAPATGAVPAFGGTPSDDTVVQAIQAMNGRGLKVQFYPFVMVDVPPGNGLPDPYGAAEQAAFPWRGRITCFPGPGQPGSADGTPAAAAQVAAFFAAYAPMVLHYAGLCAAAGGVDAFVIGSELVGLTRLRAGPGDAAYPAVQALKTLAAQVKAVVGAGCKVGYAADWCTNLMRTGLCGLKPCYPGNNRENQPFRHLGASPPIQIAQTISVLPMQFPAHRNREKNPSSREVNAAIREAVPHRTNKHHHGWSDLKTQPSQQCRRDLGPFGIALVDAAERGFIVPGMSDEPRPSQRDVMRALYNAFGGDESAVCAAYVKAEKNGKVARESNDYSIPPESYAKALWRDGISKGWLA